MSDALKIRKTFTTMLSGDVSRNNASASFILPFDTREVWGRARVPVKVTINGYMWRSTIGNRAGLQYLVVNAKARSATGVKAGDVVTITLEPDVEKREIAIPLEIRKGLGPKLSRRMNAFSFSRKKEWIDWYSAAKREETRARRINQMKQVLLSGK